MTIFTAYHSELTINQNLFFLFMGFHFFFNLDKNLPKGIVIAFGKVVRPVGGQLVSVGNISVSYQHIF